MMKRKIGRNEPCWCGSGKKFKHCHLRRADQPPPNMGEIISALSGREHLKTKICFHPESPGGCSRGVIRAHTVQRAGGRTAIARDNHVYHFQGSATRAAKSGGLDFRPESIGINKASAYPMFCSKHDTEVFKEIDTAPFSGTVEQVFELAYRAACQELYASLSRFAGVPAQQDLDRGRSEEFQEMFQTWHAMYAAVSMAALESIYNLKQEYDYALLASSHSGLHFYQIEFSARSPFLSCGVVAPEFDFAGGKLQDTRSTASDLQLVTSNVVPTPKGSAFVLAWLGNLPYVERMVTSLDSLPEEELADAVCRFIFNSFDNIYADPGWWDGLNEGIRKKMIARCLRGVLPPFPYEARHLKDDGLSFLRWGVHSRTREDGPDGTERRIG